MGLLDALKGIYSKAPVNTQEQVKKCGACNGEATEENPLIKKYGMVVHRDCLRDMRREAKKLL